MAAVPSLDRELRKMRLEKYTPAAANEARTWIEETLGERLPSPDLLEALKDGVALCKLVNLGLPSPGVKFKKSAMPFVQMENISHFLRATQSPPYSLQQHDTFLTVDLFEQKDPAQVLQCLGAFSRAANAAAPARFPNVIGPKIRAGGMSPESTGPATPKASRNRGTSINSNTSSAYGKPQSLMFSRTGDSNSGRRSPNRSPTHEPGSPGAVSSWSKKEHEGATLPAWNIAQYGYMGGASQDNLGISFGGRRQITSEGPKVPNLADKERVRREKEAEEDRQREEELNRRKAVLDAEEERARIEEEKRWESETKRLRDEERRKADDEKRRWEEEERQWKITEEKRRKEEREADARVEEERRRARSQSRGDPKLRGQFLSQYQAEQTDVSDASSRVKELEKELELARQREAEYERERQERSGKPAASPAKPAARLRSRSRPRELPTPSPAPVSSSASGPPREQNRQESWSENEREVLRTHWNQHQEAAPQPESRPAQPATTPRPLPDPSKVSQANKPTAGARPLPDPATYNSPPAAQNRTDRYLETNKPPPQQVSQATYARELGATEERDAEDRRRAQSQNKTQAGGWASKSLLEREMEMERQRQKEWEDAQKETAAAARKTDGVDGIGGGIGGRWDVGQWSGYTGGDSQNKGDQGIGAGRRQIVGPRPLPGSNR